MLLEALRDYAQTTLTPSGYGKQRVRYIVDLDADGTYLGVTDAATGTKGPDARGIERVAPVANRSVNIRAYLLVDNGEYALGVGRNANDPKVQQRHRAFRNLVAACAAATGEATVQAVRAYLDALPARPFEASEGFDPTGNVAFRVDGVFPEDLGSVRAFWASAGGEGQAGAVAECLLCGQQRPTMRLMPIRFKGVPGGQTSGTALISANSPAFESYGLQQSQIAPLCAGCAEATHKGLEALRESPRTRLRHPGLEWVFWTRSGQPAVLGDLFDNPEPEAVRELLRSVDSAREGALTLEADRFYAVSLAGNNARLAVRDWLDVSVAEVREHVKRFFRLQRIVDSWQPDDPRPIGVWQLARATTRAGEGEPPVELARPLYRLALAGGPAPTGLLVAAVARLRAERFATRGTPNRARREAVDRARLALVKLVLLSQQQTDPEEDALVGLDPNENRPSYLCGRLLAVLERLQHDALGDVNATVVDRFYGSASTTPGAAFPYLLRNAQHHLARLRRDKPGAYVGREREIQDVVRNLPGTPSAPAFPAVLALEDQGLFALGYYHQRAAYFTRAVAPAPAGIAADDDAPVTA